MAGTTVRPSQIANVPLNDNLTVLQKADPTEVAFTNSAAENTLWSYSVPGGLIGINDAIRLDTWMSILNNSGATRTYTFRLKYGATTILTLAATSSAGAGTVGGQLQAIIKNVGATNSQKCPGWVLINGGILPGYGTAAIDSTLAQTLALTVQADAATATQTLTHLFSHLEYLKNT